MICERCQMRLPERLMTFDVGIRGGTAARCAACAPPQPGPLGEANRAEVVALRKALSAHRDRNRQSVKGKASDARLTSVAQGTATGSATDDLRDLQTKLAAAEARADTAEAQLRAQERNDK